MTKRRLAAALVAISCAAMLSSGAASADNPAIIHAADHHIERKSPVPSRASIGGAPSTQVAGQASPGFLSLLEQYDRGDYGAVIERIDHLTLTDKVLTAFESEAGRWIQAGGAERTDRRVMLAATFALEIARPRDDEFPDVFYTTIVGALRVRAVVWASALVRGHAPPTPMPGEHVWYLAAIATLEKMDAWPVLTGEARVDRELRELANLAKQEGSGGLLAHAMKRFPDESRFKLASLEVREITHQGLLTDGSKIGGARWTFALDDGCQATVATLRAGIATAPANPDFSRDWHAYSQNAANVLAIIGALPALERDYLALASDPAVQAEAMLHAGYLHLRMCDWTGSLGYFQQVSTLSDDSFLVYLSHFLRGRALELSGQSPAAVAAYEDALNVRPRAWSASMRLATQLFLSDRKDDRVRAYAVMSAVGPGPAPDDPWRWFHEGDARLGPAYMVRLRDELKA